jgi:hypothetical protein
MQAHFVLDVILLPRLLSKQMIYITKSHGLVEYWKLLAHDESNYKHFARNGECAIISPSGVFDNCIFTEVQHEFSSKIKYSHLL